MPVRLQALAALVLVHLQPAFLFQVAHVKGQETERRGGCKAWNLSRQRGQNHPLPRVREDHLGFHGCRPKPGQDRDRPLIEAQLARVASDAADLHGLLGASTLLSLWSGLPTFRCAPRGGPR